MHLRTADLKRAREQAPQHDMVWSFDQLERVDLVALVALVNEAFDDLLAATAGEILA